jgi:lipopolysaccharide transport system permease protein
MPPSRPVTVFEPPDLSRLHPLAALRRLRQARDLFITLSLHRISVRYRQSRLGILWAGIHPVAMMLVFTLMFTVLRVTPAAEVPFPLFLYSGLIPWTMFSSGLSNASTALTSHAALLTKVRFPREILPLTYVVAALVDMSIASLVLAGLMMWFGVPLQPTALWAIVAVFLVTGLLVGLGLLLSAVQVRFRDVGLAMPVLVQVWLFATPVLYPLSAAKSALPEPLYWLYRLNPMAGVVDTFRRAVVLHQSPDLGALAVSAAVVTILLPVAYVYFKQVELTMADLV